MNLIKLAWKNIVHDPLTLFLNLVLLTLGIGLINFILLLNTQLKDKFEKNLADIHMVVGAKGSPLQMILNSMYHIDAPTGNISIKEAKPFLREKHPLIAKSVPLSMGDSYRGYRIIGTDHTIIDFYQAEISQGKLWNNLYEVTIGAEVARAQGLQLGSKFNSSHGFVDDEDLAHDHAALTVIGILKETGSVIDQLILVSTESVWAVHDHDHEEHDHEEDSHDHEEDHAHEDEHGHAEEGDGHSHGAEITGETLLGLDFTWKWAPNGNYKDKNLTLSAEYIRLNDLFDSVVGSAEGAPESLDGWYLSAAYQFAPKWTAGLRYGEVDIYEGDVHLDEGEVEGEYDLETISELDLSLAWHPSHFSTVRATYTREELDGHEGTEEENIFVLQYVMSLGAHRAHSF